MAISSSPSIGELRTTLGIDGGSLSLGDNRVRNIPDKVSGQISLGDFIGKDKTLYGYQGPYKNVAAGYTYFRTLSSSNINAVASDGNTIAVGREDGHVTIYPMDISRSPAYISNVRTNYDSIYQLISPAAGIYLNFRDGGGVYRTTNNGVTWTYISVKDVNGSLLEEVSYLVQLDNGAIYAYAYEENAWSRSTDNGATWTGLALPISNLQKVVNIGNTLYAISGTTLYKSTNGTSWTNLGAHGFPNNGIHLTANDNHLIGITEIFPKTATGGLYDMTVRYKYSSNGTSWTNREITIRDRGYTSYSIKGIGDFALLMARGDCYRLDVTGGRWMKVWTESMVGEDTQWRTFNLGNGMSAVSGGGKLSVNLHLCPRIRTISSGFPEGVSINRWSGAANAAHNRFIVQHGAEWREFDNGSAQGTVNLSLYTSRLGSIKHYSIGPDETLVVMSGSLVVLYDTDWTTELRSWTPQGSSTHVGCMNGNNYVYIWNDGKRKLYQLNKSTGARSDKTYPPSAVGKSASFSLDPYNDNVLLGGGANSYGLQTYYSTDAGATWTYTAAHSYEGYMMVVNGCMLVQVDGRSVRMSYNKGVSWIDYNYTMDGQGSFFSNARLGILNAKSSRPLAIILLDKNIKTIDIKTGDAVNTFSPEYPENGAMITYGGGTAFTENRLFDGYPAMLSTRDAIWLAGKKRATYYDSVCDGLVYFGPHEDY